MTLLVWVKERGYSDKVANSLIKQGKVRINTVMETLPNYKIKKDDIIELVKMKEKYVSRGAYKLLEAINKFNINFKEKVVLDIGASTGGFTQVALEHGANLVYAVDVGENQLDYSLRTNKNVVSMEKTNVKCLEKGMFNKKIDIVVSDVSFISLKRVIDVIYKILESGIDFIALIKPQFEANSRDVEKGGFVEENKHQKIIDSINKYAKQKCFELIQLVKSPIKGKNSKNQEYLAWYKRREDE